MNPAARFVVVLLLVLAAVGVIEWITLVNIAP